MLVIGRYGRVVVNILESSEYVIEVEEDCYGNWCVFFNFRGDEEICLAEFGKDGEEEAIALVEKLCDAISKGEHKVVHV